MQTIQTVRKIKAKYVILELLILLMAETEANLYTDGELA